MYGWWYSPEPTVVESGSFIFRLGNTTNKHNSIIDSCCEQTTYAYNVVDKLYDLGPGILCPRETGTAGQRKRYGPTLLFAREHENIIIIRKNGGFFIFFLSVKTVHSSSWRIGLRTCGTDFITKRRL